MNSYVFKQFIKLKALFIRGKKLRNRYKRIYSARFFAQKVRQVRWGVSYSVFDGVELLESALANIRPHADYISVVYQDVSWYGEPAPEPMLPLLEKLKAQGLIDTIIFFEPDFRRSAGQNERRKRSLGLRDAKRHRVEYYMSMDVDEFYFADEIENAKYRIVRKGITRACVGQDTYGEEPTQKCLYSINSFVPFFSRINFFSRHAKDAHLPCLCDPNRQLNHQLFDKYYVLNTCSMQHMSKVRVDLARKLRNSSGKMFPVPERYFLSAKTENWFDISI